MPQTIELEHYARFRELRGCASEEISTTASTPGELFRELGFDQAIPTGDSGLRVAINDAFASWDDPLRDGDRVVFMLPMAGG